jgi:hypothetical protein
MLSSFSFVNVVLKCLKQFASMGCNAWDVCEAKVTISNPNVYVNSIICRVTWPRPFRINKGCQKGKVNKKKKKKLPEI